MQSCGQTSTGASPPQVAVPPLPLLNTTSLEAASAYSLKEFAYVLVKKDDLRDAHKSPRAPEHPNHTGRSPAQSIVLFQPLKIKYILLDYV